MKVYISVDIEGITGLVSWSQCSRPDGNSYDYQFARRMMTHDVNAAIRGARRAGATTVVVKDSHGNSKNLLVADLEPGTQLISGHGAGTDGMMQGIDETFDAAILVGYHAMAGTQAGVMEHTLTGGEHWVWLNEQKIGEIALSAGVAGSYGVPLVMISSDHAGCKEAQDLIPGIETAVVKTGHGRYMANLLHPSETGPLIEEAAFRALEAKSVTPLSFPKPCTAKVEFNRAESADMAARLRGITRLDAYSTGGEFSDFTEAHQAIWNMMAMMHPGLGNQH